MGENYKLVISSRPLRVLVEIDSGARRGGVRPQEAGELAAQCIRLGMDVAGIFTYPGHAGKSRDARPAGADNEVRAAEQAIASFAARGIPAGIVSAGSTPTARFSARAPITELRPGEYIFTDADNVRLGTCDSLADVGLLVATTVVSTAVEGQVTIDAGTKVLGREGNPEKGFGLAPSIPGSFLRLLNEHHGYLSVPDGVQRPAVGDVLTLVPNHLYGMQIQLSEQAGSKAPVGAGKLKDRVAHRTLVKGGGDMQVWGRHHLVHSAALRRVVGVAYNARKPGRGHATVSTSLPRMCPASLTSWAVAASVRV